MSSFENFGYESNEPCCVCGKNASLCKIEPRFFYSVCEDHYEIPPVEITRLDKNTNYK